MIDVSHENVIIPPLEDVSTFLHIHLASAPGLFQMTDHTESQKLFMANEDFASLRVDFG